MGLPSSPYAHRSDIENAQFELFLLYEWMDVFNAIYFSFFSTLFFLFCIFLKKRIYTLKNCFIVRDTFMSTTNKQWIVIVYHWNETKGLLMTSCKWKLYVCVYVCVNTYSCQDETRNLWLPKKIILKRVKNNTTAKQHWAGSRFHCAHMCFRFIAFYSYYEVCA